MTFIKARALNNLVTLNTLKALNILNILTVRNALTALPFVYVSSVSAELSELGITNSTIESKTINASNKFILSPA